MPHTTTNAVSTICKKNTMHTSPPSLPLLQAWNAFVAQLIMFVVSWTYLNPWKAAQIEQRFKWKNQDLLHNHTEERDWKYQERRKICFHTCRKYHVWCRKNVSSASITKFEPPATILPRLHDYVTKTCFNLLLKCCWRPLKDCWKATIEQQ
jgi:hypothetical protein